MTQPLENRDGECPFLADNDPHDRVGKQGEDERIGRCDEGDRVRRFQIRGDQLAMIVDIGEGRHQRAQQWPDKGLVRNAGEIIRDAEGAERRQACKARQKQPIQLPVDGIQDLRTVFQLIMS